MFAFLQISFQRPRAVLQTPVSLQSLYNPAPQPHHIPYLNGPSLQYCMFPTKYSVRHGHMSRNNIPDVQSDAPHPFDSSGGQTRQSKPKSVSHQCGISLHPMTLENSAFHNQHEGKIPFFTSLSS